MMMMMIKVMTVRIMLVSNLFLLLFFPTSKNGQSSEASSVQGSPGFWKIVNFAKQNLKITEQQTNNNYSIPSAYLQSVARRRRTTAAQRLRRRRSTSSTWPRKGSSATNARVFMFLDFCQLLLLPLCPSQTSLLPCT